MKSRSERYDRNARARRLQHERGLMGETLDAFHRRETAPPPTLREVYEANHKNRERCAVTVDLFETKPRKRTKP